MSKKSEQIELTDEIPADTTTVDLTVPETTAMSTASEDALAYLKGELAQEQVASNEFQSFKAPALTFYISGKQYTENGANRGFVIDYLDEEKGIEVNVEKVRLFRLDTPIYSRVMWPYDTKSDGRRPTKLQGEQYKDPLCASSDGEQPREQYVGQKYFDTRLKREVEIIADCTTCPFGQWMGIVDEAGQPLMERNAKGVVKQTNGKFLCEERPRIPVFDLDRRRVMVLKVGGFIRNTFTLGEWTQQYGAIKGINWYYNTDSKLGRAPIEDEQGNLRALNMTVQMVKTNGFGSQPAPLFEIGDVLTPDEIADLTKFKRMYKEQKIRTILSGQWKRDDAYDDEAAGQTAPAQREASPF